MELILPQWGTSLPHIGALGTTRPCGISASPYDDGQGGGGLNLGIHVGDMPAHVEHNRAQIRRQLPAEPAWLTQVHGTTVVDAAQVSGAPEADASYTTQAGVVCAIRVFATTIKPLVSLSRRCTMPARGTPEIDGK